MGSPDDAQWGGHSTFWVGVGGATLPVNWTRAMKSVQGAADDTGMVLEFDGTAADD